MDLTLPFGCDLLSYYNNVNCIFLMFLLCFFNAISAFFIFHSLGYNHQQETGTVWVALAVLEAHVVPVVDKAQKTPPPQMANTAPTLRPAK